MIGKHVFSFTFVEKIEAMIQAVFTIPLSEFDPHVVEKIKNFFNGDGDDVEIVIGVRPKKSSVLRHETREEYFSRMEKSIDDAANNRNMVTFDSVEELADHFKK